MGKALVSVSTPWYGEVSLLTPRPSPHCGPRSSCGCSSACAVVVARASAKALEESMLKRVMGRMALPSEEGTPMLEAPDLLDCYGNTDQVAAPVRSDGTPEAQPFI